MRNNYFKYTLEYGDSIKILLSRFYKCDSSYMANCRLFFKEIRKLNPDIKQPYQMLIGGREVKLPISFKDCKGQIHLFNYVDRIIEVSEVQSKYDGCNCCMRNSNIRELRFGCNKQSIVIRLCDNCYNVFVHMINKLEVGK